jgi:WD40 repeat protein
MTNLGQSEAPMGVVRDRWAVRLQATLTGHSDGTWALSWGQLGDRPVLASGHDDGGVRLWDPETRRELATLTGPSGTVMALAWGLVGDRPVLVP